jgi:aminopeptidase
MANNVTAGSHTEITKKNVNDILTICMEHMSAQNALIVSDERSELAKILTKAYLENLPSALHIQFDDVSQETILKAFEKLKAKDLVILIQSTSFRLNEFRIRVELFKRGLKVIEHPHLARMVGDEIKYYINALAYDPSYYRVVGPALKQRIDSASQTIVNSGGAELIYDCGLESAKLNIGDYSTMNNIGGQFPIGEVFTEAKDLERVNGKIKIFAFGDGDFKVNVPKNPITLVIEKGKVIEVKNSTTEFDSIMKQIREDEGVVWIRELGFGMNRALTRENILSDIGSYERMCAVHLSLGVKHGVYKKPDFKQRATGFHLDVFAVTETVKIDGEIIYKDGAWCV